MAEDFTDNADRSEEATPERRDEFRERGQIAFSRELTSVFALMAAVVFLSSYAGTYFNTLKHSLRNGFQNFYKISINTPEDLIHFTQNAAFDLLRMIAPVCLVVAAVASFTTLLQTQFNWSWEKLKPDFSKLNPIAGLANMFNTQALVNLLKGIGKMAAVTIVAYLILYSEWIKMPSLINYSSERAWAYWADITKNLFYGVSALLFVIAGGDYLFNFLTFEKQMKMTKQEVKEEYKRREVDPHVKAKIKKMQKDFSFAKVVKATAKATVIVTNPTHFAVALQYEMGMAAPVVVAKGQDFLALEMRRIANENSIPIVENPPLARTLFKLVDIGGLIPESLYKAVSEVIKYVFKLKGMSLKAQTKGAQS
ncbi:MAG: flagellar biosynthesis protein FlhB [Oligoflexales bacterium]